MQNKCEINFLFVYVFGITVLLNLNINSVNAQKSQSWWDSFRSGMIEELGSRATEKVLDSLFKTEAEAERSAQSNQSVMCEVTDPTGTPLNVRSTPNGSEIVTQLSNGRKVVPYKVGYDTKNRHWILIGDNIHSWGWVFGSYVSCFVE